MRKVISITDYDENSGTAWSWHYISAYLEEVQLLPCLVPCDKGHHWAAELILPLTFT